MKKSEPVVHLASHIIFAGIVAFCGAGMQAGMDKWHSDIHYWGLIGIIKHKKIELLTFDDKHATCSRCLAKRPKKARRK